MNPLIKTLAIGLIVATATAAYASKPMMAEAQMLTQYRKSAAAVTWPTRRSFSPNQPGHVS